MMARRWSRADHRFLTERGWKFVTGKMSGVGQRPYLTLNNKLMGTGSSRRPWRRTRTIAAATFAE